MKPPRFKFDKQLTIPHTTGKFPVNWANLTKPNTKFNPDGVYDIELLLTEDDVEPIKAVVEQIIKDATKQYKAETKRSPPLANSRPYREQVDKETGEPTGMWLLKAKMSATSKQGDNIVNVRPVIVDSQMKPLAVSGVGRGSIVRVNLTLMPYFVPASGLGVSSRLDAVQIIELKGFTPRDPLLGFVAEEGVVGDGIVAAEAGDSNEGF